jgi:hypothetical protein
VTVGLDKWWFLDHGDIGCASTIASIQLNFTIADATVNVEQCSNGHWCTALIDWWSGDANWTTLSFDVLQLLAFFTLDVA